MPQPTLLKVGGRAFARVGGLALPNGQAALRAAMLADVPVALWRGAEQPGATVLADAMGAFPGVFVEPVMKGMPGLTADPDTALGMNWYSGSLVGYSQIPWAAALAPAQFSTVVVFLTPVAPWTGNAGLLEGRFSTTAGFALLQAANGQVIGEVGTGAAQTQIGPGTQGLPAFGVTHIGILTFDGTSARLYVDGVLVAGPTAVAYSANPSAVLRIGYNTGGGVAYNGYEMLAGIYNFALSQARATAYTAALAGTIADLNDGVNTTLRGFGSDDDNVQNTLQQLLYMARGVYTDQDFGPRHITLPVTYQEDGSHFVGQFLAALSQAGEQELSFDNNATVIPVRYNGATRKPVKQTLPLAWELQLDFLARSPFFSDTALTSSTPQALTTDAGTSFSLTYLGSVFAEPIWTLQVPAGNAVALNSFQLQNTMSGETLTVNFLSVAAIPASTPRTIRIDTAAMTAVDNLGNSYDVSGSFPRLYPPAGQVNTFKTVVVPASGASSGLTLKCEYSSRWQI